MTEPDLVLEFRPPTGVTRYLLTDGRIIDVRSSHSGGSHERSFVLEEAKRRWGGKADDWKITGAADVSHLADDDGDGEPT